MAGPSPASCLRAGTVFRSAATWWVLAARQGRFLVFCPILAPAENHHRADLPIPWADALLAGCPDGARIRCRPVFRPSTRGLTVRGQFSTRLTDRLVHSLRAELRCRRQEDAERAGFHPQASCTGAHHRALVRSEPGSPRSVHFF